MLYIFLYKKVLYFLQGYFADAVTVLKNNYYKSLHPRPLYLLVVEGRRGGAETCYKIELDKHHETIFD